MMSYGSCPVNSVRCDARLAVLTPTAETVLPCQYCVMHQNRRSRCFNYYKAKSYSVWACRQFAWYTDRTNSMSRSLACQTFLRVSSSHGTSEAV